MKKWVKELNKAFSKVIQMTKKHMKKCSPSLAIKNMQMKNMLRSYLTPVRIATIRNMNNNKFWRQCEEKGSLRHFSKMVQPLWKTAGRVLKNLQIELPYDPVILLRGIYQKECKS
jgi:hypothetical protein